MDANLGLLQHYQQLLATSTAMLVLTKSGRWDELIAYEVDYLSAVEKLTRYPGCKRNCAPASGTNSPYSETDPQQ